MSVGKAIAQAGHAYTDSISNSLTTPLSVCAEADARAYALLRPGTKICLDGGSLTRIERLCSSLEELHIPFVRIVDRDHVEAPHFDGSPTLTAIGIGPLRASMAPKLLRRLPLWRGGLAVSMRGAA